MLTITDAARKRIVQFMQEQGDGKLALRVALQPGSPLAPNYDLALVEEWEEQPGDQVIELDEFKVFVDGGSADRLEGSTVDWVETHEGGGFQVENPNVGKPESLTGPMADRVRDVLKRQVNPAVKMHGGHVELADIRDNVVYLEMSGGCQGCGMASVTLRQGIEKMLKQAIPEVAGVEDITDHSQGTNPYYQSSK